MLMNTRAVQGWSGSGLCPTRNRPVGIGREKNAPAKVIGSGGSNHQQVAGGSVGVIYLGRWRETVKKTQIQ